MSAWFRFWFLFSSFGPLYLIFSIKMETNKGVAFGAALFFLGLFVLSVAVFGVLVRTLRSDNGTPHEIDEAVSKDGEIFNYLMTYIPPLISGDMSDISIYMPLFILYAILSVFYFRLDSPYLHPYFVLVGYRIYEARMKKSGNLVTIIAKGRRIMGSEEVTLYEVGSGDLYYFNSE
jgi:hypothetical protein